MYLVFCNQWQFQTIFFLKFDNEYKKEYEHVDIINKKELTDLHQYQAVNLQQKLYGKIVRHSQTPGILEMTLMEREVSVVPQGLPPDESHREEHCCLPDPESYDSCL